jgi:diamine N-acetyltransferase
VTETVTLREITDANRAAVEALSITPAQETYVASVADSLVEAAETPDACPWFRAVYAGEVPVGFVMISDNIPPERTEYLGPYFLWRLLIDEQFQGWGYGRAVLDLTVDYVRSRPNAEKLYSSTVPGEESSPLGFYLKYGFVPTGAVHDDEPVLVLELS